MPTKTDLPKYRPAGRIFEPSWSWTEILPITSVQIQAHVPDSEENKRPAVAKIAVGQTAIGDESVDEKRTCRMCNCLFSDREEQTAHFRSDWHRHNLHLSLRAKEAISEQQFDEWASDDEETSTDSESSSCEDEDFDGAPDFFRQSSQLYFVVNGQIFSVYKRILPVSTDAASGLKQLSNRPNIVIVLLLAAGRFAGAIYEDGELIEHKTFQRYTVRAKQGGAQGAQDGKRAKAPKSAGAALRRYNEQALAADIQSLLVGWQSLLTRASVVFLRCSTYQRHIFFADNASDAFFNRTDQRVRTIPFITRRPTLDECKRIFERLTTVYCHGSADEFWAHCAEQEAKKKAKRIQFAKRTKQLSRKAGDLPDSPSSSDNETKQQEGQNRQKIRPKTVKTADQEIDLFPDVPAALRQQLYTAIRTDDKSGLLALLDQHDTVRDQILVYLSQVRLGVDQTTFLHETASRGSADMLKTLLELGCDPGSKNGKGQVPYQVSFNRPIRQVFVDYRLQQSPDRWDWGKTQIPLPVEQPDDPERDARAAEKKRLQKQMKREREKVRKAEETKQRNEQQEQERYLALSDREKRALAAERRLLQPGAGSTSTQPIVLSRCFKCAADITGKVPFEYSTNRFCSVKCVREHRSQ